MYGKSKINARNEKERRFYAFSVDRSPTESELNKKKITPLAGKQN
jgi:hypothetical protein